MFMSYLIQKTEEFDSWLLKLRDRRAKAKIIIRLQRGVTSENGI